MKNSVVQEEINRLEARVVDLTTLIEVSNIINSTFDMDELIQLVMEKAQTVMHAEASSIMLINEESGRLECEVALGKVGDQVRKTIVLEKGQGVAGWVWENEQPLIVPDVSRDPRFFSDIDRRSGFQTRSILAVPLEVKGRMIGVGEVINRSDGTEFTDYDLNLFTTFCRQVALAIENTRMHQMRVEQERMRQQLESARVIQQSFMPDVLPVSPENRFCIAARNYPAITVSGDFYDVLQLNDRQLALFIGDVSGKGIPAALFMARLMSDFRFYVQQVNSPSELLNRLNKAVVENSRQGMFVTLQYVVVDITDGRVAFCNGGHLPILQVHNDDSSVDLIEAAEGAPLGITADLDFETAEFSLRKGDVLLFYTDGITEAKNSAGEQFTIDRLLACAGRKIDHPETLVQKVVSSVKKFCDQTPQNDDITTLAFQWNG